MGQSLAFEQVPALVAVLKGNLDTIRCRGWATGEGERVPGAFGLAAPFFVDGKVKGSISATIPQHRKNDCDLPTLLEGMKGASNRIGKLLSLKKALSQDRVARTTL